MEEHMTEKQNEIKEMLKHYKKLKNRWNTIDSILKTTNLTFTLIMAFSTAVSASLTVPVFVPIILGIVSASSSTGIIAIKYSSKKKEYFKRKVRLIDEYLNKLYIFFEKSKADKIISVEEVEEFNMLLTEFESELKKLITKNVTLKKR